MSMARTALFSVHIKERQCMLKDKKDHGGIGGWMQNTTVLKG